MKAVVVIIAIALVAILAIRHYVPTLEHVDLSRNQSEQLRQLGQ